MIEDLAEGLGETLDKGYCITVGGDVGIAGLGESLGEIGHGWGGIGQVGFELV